MTKFRDIRDNDAWPWPTATPKFLSETSKLMDLETETHC